MEARATGRNPPIDSGAQFTESVSAHFESAPPATKGGAGAPNATHYAEAPLLNPQQLVCSRSMSRCTSQSRWDRQTVPVPIAEKGVYLVEAVHADLRAYTILIVSDIALITKTGKGRLVNLLVDQGALANRSHMEPCGSKGATRNFGSTETDATGFAVAPFDGSKADDVRIVARGA